MCRLESNREERESKRRRWWVIGIGIGMGVKIIVSDDKKEKSNKSSNGGVSSRSKMKTWIVRATTSLFLWTCILQMTMMGDFWGPGVLKGWPSCYDSALDDKLPSIASVPPRVLLPKSYT